jgi:hypothetical protein
MLAMAAEQSRRSEAPHELIPVLAKAHSFWMGEAVDPVTLMEGKQACWQFLERKNGDSTTISDAEDRWVRGTLCLLDPPGDDCDLEGRLEWFRLMGTDES